MKRLIGIAVALAVVAATFVFVLPRIANYGQVWDTVRALTWWQILLLAGATVLNVVSFAFPFMAALPGLGLLRAVALTQASTAATYIAPGAGAVGAATSFAILRVWGFPPSAVTLAVTIVSVWNQLFLLGAPPVALALLTLEGGSNALLQSVALFAFAGFVVGVTAFAAALSADEVARWVGGQAARLASWALRLVRRPPVTWAGESLVRFRHEALGLLRRRWLSLTASTIAANVSVFLVLLVCLRTLGVSAHGVTVVEAFAAWTLARLLQGLPLTPGGVGVVEVGLTGALIGFGGRNAGVVAAVLVYRFLTIVPTLVLGLIAAATYRRQRLRDAPA